MGCKGNVFGAKGNRRMDKVCKGRAQFLQIDYQQFMKILDSVSVAAKWHLVC